MNTFLHILLIPTFTLMVLSFSLAPLGCFLVWRRLAFFGDGLSHACTFGVAIAFFLKVHFLLGILFIALVIALILLVFEKYKDLSIDTLFSLLSYTFFAGGIVALSLFKGARISIDDILFGDFLSMGSTELFLAIIAAAITLFTLFRYWPTLVLHGLSPDLASVSHLHSRRAQVVFILVTAGAVALGMYLLGALLLPALMILPAACARLVSTSPRQMVISSALISMVGCALGIGSSYVLNTPTSATMVLACSFLFVIVFAFKKSLSHV